jgi:adenylate cyclase class IV
MPSNIELKVRWDNSDLAVEKAKSFGASFSKILKQCDTYYINNNEKLKLREVYGENAELIYYLREGDEK